MVLLKNNGPVLPLDTSKLRSIALIGPSAASAKTGGGGSSNVTASYTVAPLAGMQARAGARVSVALSNGSDTAAASALARSSDVVIVMVGDNQSEGSDPSISLSGNQNALVQAIASANPNTIVVLKTGTAALMPWVNQVPAILEAWYPGQEDGNAVADVLFGDVNPSGKLPLTFPASVSDQPGQVGTGSSITYTEGVFVGYRHYDTRNITPLFPFGHGLSYTTFQYQNFSISPGRSSSVDKLQPNVRVELDVTNSGAVAGAEAVQVYIGMPTNDVPQPPKQLKGLQKIQLNPGQTGHLQLDLDFRSFAYWDVISHDWKVTAGTHQIFVGSSSRDIRFQGQITIPGTTEVASDKKPVPPDAFKLEQNFPNPFNPSTSFKYQTAKAGFVSIKIYDVLGREVATLVNEVKQVGSYSATWNAAGFGSGIYICKMQSGSFAGTKKIILLK